MGRDGKDVHGILLAEEETEALPLLSAVLAPDEPEVRPCCIGIEGPWVLRVIGHRPYWSAGQRPAYGRARPYALSHPPSPRCPPLPKSGRVPARRSRSIRTGFCHRPRLSSREDPPFLRGREVARSA